MFPAIKQKAEQDFQSSSADAIERHREQGLMGRVAVKPTCTPSIQCFQLTLITGMDESTCVLLVNKFKVRLLLLEPHGSVRSSDIVGWRG